MPDYTITTERLGLRNWVEADFAKQIEISGDAQVMRHFPAVATPEQTRSFLERMQTHFEEHGFCYFAADRLDTGEMIGFIGMMWQTWEGEFTPFFDIGWRLSPSAWGNGFATEGAKACLEAAFNRFGLTEVYSTCPQVNIASESVMKKIGMKQISVFNHSKLMDFPHLNPCLMYKITAAEYQAQP